MYYYKVAAINENGEGPQSPAISDTILVPAVGTGTPLTGNTWADGDLSVVGEIDWYQFTAASTTTYYVQWDDAAGNSVGGKTAWTAVSAYRAGDGTPVFTRQNSGFTYPQSVSVNAGETIYIRVEGLDSWNTGTYAVQYY
jgi:hypothetical protein